MPRIKRQKSKHPNQRKSPDTITYRVIKEFKRVPITGKTNNGNFYVLWCVHWCNSETPVFEKRRLYVRKDGVTRVYKLAGLNYEDYSWLTQNWTAVVEALCSI
jgi:hypothetical protein